MRGWEHVSPALVKKLRPKNVVTADPFLALVHLQGLPLPQTEFRFDPIRRWRFDYAWVDRLVAIECEGGAWTKGRHTRGTGFIKDMEKYNAAQLAGWVVLRYTPQQLSTGQAMSELRQALKQ